MADRPDAALPTRLERVLIAAPFRRDAALLQGRLEKLGIAAQACNDPDELAHELSSEPAALLLSQEALTPHLFQVVADHLATQPDWSELPLVLLLDEEHQNRSVLAGLRARLPTSKLTVLQRPIRLLELVTTVQTALAARRRQFQLRDHLVWQQELQRELNHRVKNTLANVMAIYHMTLRQSSSLPDFATSFEGRLTALSRVHHSLTISSEPRSLMEIASVVLDPYRSRSPERVVIDGPHCTVTPQLAVTLALCLHELATNAAKYGALLVPQGSVTLVWAFEGDWLRLCWSESHGPPVGVRSRRGYGTSFIESATRGGLGGRVEFRFNSSGLVCEMLLPETAFARIVNEVEGVQRAESSTSGTVRAVSR